VIRNRRSISCRRFSPLRGAYSALRLYLLEDLTAHLVE
jgi:hypothetical protein